MKTEILRMTETKRIRLLEGEVRRLRALEGRVLEYFRYKQQINSFLEGRVIDASVFIEGSGLARKAEEALDEAINLVTGRAYHD